MHTLRRRHRAPAAELTAYTSADVRAAIAAYEERYRMSSAEFLSLWRARQLDHGDYDLSRWALLLSSYERARKAEAAV